MPLERVRKNVGRSSLADEHKRAHLRILYIEDDDINWDVASLALGSEYTIERARDAHEAFRLLERHEFDIVLVDIELAGSDFSGIEITQIIRSAYDGQVPNYAARFRSQTLPIIFVTAYSARYKKEDLRAVGGNDMINKPVNFTNLRLAISRLLVQTLLKP